MHQRDSLFCLEGQSTLSASANFIDYSAPGLGTPDPDQQRNLYFSFQTYAEDNDSALDPRQERSVPGAPIQSSSQSWPAACQHKRAVRDKRLLEQLYEQVALQGNLETHDLRLNVSNGVVVIEGSVSDLAMKSAIDRVVRRCTSVRHVINRIWAGRPSSSDV